jgi:exodeoxyribonuclease VII small subunit
MSQSFEELMRRLEDIVEKLESNELSLEQAIEAYQEGVTLAKLGHTRLGEAERRIEEVTRAGDRTPVAPEDLLGSNE